MQKALAITFASILMIIAVAAYSQDRVTDRPQVEFKNGTVLSVTTHTSGGGSIYIQDPIAKKFGDTWFIVGTGPNIQGFPHIGNRIWISMNSVSFIHEFKDVDEVRKLLALPPNPAA
jgi:hypothetical protein